MVGSLGRTVAPPRPVATEKSHDESRVDIQRDVLDVFRAEQRPRS